MSVRAETSTADFVPAAERAIRRSQRALRAVMDDAGLEDARAVDLARTLKLDKTLAWKVARFTIDADPQEAFRHLPGRGGMELVVTAAKKLGIASGRLEEARKADRDLRGLVRLHAGDRRTFEAMLAGVRPDAAAELEERKAYFKSGSAIWGVRAHAQVLTLALKPADDAPDKLDCISLSGFVRLERLRSDVPWVVRRLRTHADDGTAYEPFERVPLDAAGAASAGSGERPLALMADYCSQPLPTIRQRMADNGWLYDEIAPGDVGRPGAVTVVSGERYRHALPRHRSADNTEGRYVLTVRTPLERVQLDLLLHPSLTNFRWPSVTVTGNLEERASSERAPGRELFPVRPAEAVTPGSASFDANLLDLRQLLPDAFERGGFGDVSSYRGFRATVEYPPSPCEVMVTSELA